MNITNRMNINEYYLRIAFLASERGTCKRRKVGCVLTDEKNRVISIGYNGNPAGRPHCIDISCLGAIYKSGEGLDKCEAIHAEISALGACRDIQVINTCYSTTAPCIHCVQSLLATPCKTIIFYQPYPHTQSEERWISSGRQWIQFNKFDITELHCTHSDLKFEKYGRFCECGELMWESWRINVGILEINMLQTLLNDTLIKFKYIENEQGDWCTPKEFENKKEGDCDSFAIYMFFELKKRKFNTKLMICQLRNKNQFHMICLCELDSIIYVLDTISDKVMKLYDRVELDIIPLITFDDEKYPFGLTKWKNLLERMKKEK